MEPEALCAGLDRPGSHQAAGPVPAHSGVCRPLRGQVGEEERGLNWAPLPPGWPWLVLQRPRASSLPCLGKAGRKLLCGVQHPTHVPRAAPCLRSHHQSKARRYAPSQSTLPKGRTSIPNLLGMAEAAEPPPAGLVLDAAWSPGGQRRSCRPRPEPGNTPLPALALAGRC